VKRICSLLLALLTAVLVLSCLASCSKGSSSSMEYHQAQALLEGRQFGEALAKYEKVLAIEPESKLAVYGKGRCLYELKRYSEALPLFEHFLTMTEEERAVYDDERYDAAFYRDKCKQALGQEVPQNPNDIPPPPMGE